MNLVDSCGWLEYFADGPNSDLFAPVLEQTEDLIVPTICLYEVYKRICQQLGPKAAMETTAAMWRAKTVPLTDRLAMDAALIGHQFKLPMADSVILATARFHGAILWTQDAHFANFPEVRYFPAK